MLRAGRQDETSAAKDAFNQPDGATLTELKTHFTVVQSLEKISALLHPVTAVRWSA